MAEAKTVSDVKEILGPGGPVSQLLAGFEVRREQVQMAREVQRALLKGRRLAVEAGTGVGKSFAYLVPAVDLACREAGKV